MAIELIDLEYLPEGALTRYYRDIYAISDQSIPFKEFVIEAEARSNQECEERNRLHPITFDKTIVVGPNQTVHLFKRQGEEWSYSFCDMNPNGGEGCISLEEALNYITQVDGLDVR